MNNIQLISTNDIWLDYGLEHLYRLLQDCEGVSKLELNENSILFNIDDKEKLKESLAKQLFKVRDNLYLTTEQGKQTHQIIHQILLGDNLKMSLGGIYYRQNEIRLKEDNRIADALDKKENLTKTEENQLNNLKKRIERIERKKENKEIGKSVNDYMNAIFYKDSIDKPCPLCGEQITKANNITQSTYPFSTKSGNFSKIKGLSGGYFGICSRCYLYGQLAIGDRLLINNGMWKNRETYCDIFLPQCKNLKQLNEIKEKIGFFVKYGYRRGNIGFATIKDEKEKFITPFDNYSALLQIYNQFINYIVDRTKEGLKFEIKLLALKWIILSIKDAGKTIIKTYEIDIPEETVDLMWNLQKKEGINLYAEVINNIFDLKNDDMRAPAKALSKAIITDDFNIFVESVIPKGNRNILVKCGKDTEYGLYKLYILIDYWRLNKMDLNKEEQELLKEWGEALASVCANKKTFVYRLDKKRRFEDFIETFKDIIVYTMGKTHKVKDEEKPYYLPYDYKKEGQKVNKDILNLFMTHKNDWEELKNVFVAYLALNTHIKSKSKKSTTGGNEK